VSAGSPLALWLAVAAALAAVLVAATTSLAWPRVHARLMRLAPARRARVSTAMCLAPLAAGLALALACLLPSLYAALWPALDHCTHHADEHLHLCLVHPPAVALGVAAAWVGAGALAVVLLRGAPGLARLLRAHRTLARLQDASSPAESGVRSVDTDAAFSFAGGALRPTIFLSRGLEARLSAQELAVVLAHERAHVRRRDVLRRHVARLGALLHAPGAGRALLSALELACEEACDAEAAATLGDRELVAQTIVAVARLVPRPPPAIAATAAGFTAEALTHRVTALLSTPAPEPVLPRWRLALAAAALVLLAPALHHATETVLSLLARP
jgi:Zn-dependent protease with chaperone function